jgi:casein kinase 1
MSFDATSFLDGGGSGRGGGCADECKAGAASGAGPASASNRVAGHKPPSVLGARYKVLGHIGSGAFGDLYAGKDQRTGTVVAIKIEALSCNPPQLPFAVRAYESVQGCHGFARIRASGTQGHFRYMVMDMLGASLGKLLNQRPSKHFSVKTALQLCDQAITRLETLHDAGYLHRDIKPDNLLMGSVAAGAVDAARLYLVDFGLVTKWRVDKSWREHGLGPDGRKKIEFKPVRLRGGETGWHIPERGNRSSAGTPMFMSCNGHRGVTQSRRDDMECMAYVGMFILSGTLPFFHLFDDETGEEGDTAMDALEEKILHSKSNTATSEFTRHCGLKGKVSDAFAYWMEHARNLGFTERPAYARIRRRLRMAATNAGIEYDGVYDWSGK